MARRVLPGIVLLTLAAIAGLGGWFGHGAAADGSQAAISRELTRLFQADQADRESFSNLTQEQIRDLNARDKQRRARVAEIISRGQLQSAKDYYHAAMVFQHGDTPEEYLLAHELATVAGFKGDKGGRWLSAAALDRFLHAIGRPQRFGTQYRRDGGGPWTQEPYERSLPDRLRREYGVPPLADQAKPLEELNRK